MRYTRGVCRWAHTTSTTHSACGAYIIYISTILTSLTIVWLQPNKTNTARLPFRECVLVECVLRALSGSLHRASMRVSCSLYALYAPRLLLYTAPEAVIICLSIALIIHIYFYHIYTERLSTSLVASMTWYICSYDLSCTAAYTPLSLSTILTIAHLPIYISLRQYMSLPSYSTWSYTSHSTGYTRDIISTRSIYTVNSQDTALSVTRRTSLTL